MAAVSPCSWPRMTTPPGSEEPAKGKEGAGPRGGSFRLGGRRCGPASPPVRRTGSRATIVPLEGWDAPTGLLRGMGNVIQITVSGVSGSIGTRISKDAGSMHSWSRSRRVSCSDVPGPSGQDHGWEGRQDGSGLHSSKCLVRRMDRLFGRDTCPGGHPSTSRG